MLRELDVWLRLKHSTIVPLLGTAQVESPLLALVSQWMSCGTLVKYLDDISKTSVPFVVLCSHYHGFASG